MPMNVKIFFILWLSSHWAAAQIPENLDYTKLDLEELLTIKVVTYSSVARKQQTLMDTAAALFVLTQENILNSGMTSVPEMLRQVPGLQVTRPAAHQWAITARGLNQPFSSKLLVMADGRSIYTPLRSEILWNSVNPVIEDIDYIEVIRGPGASLWGSNAVNGVINIVTQSTKETQGTLISGSVGQGEERNIISWRQGGKLTDQGFYRVYGKFLQQGNFVDSQTVSLEDKWQMAQAGFRSDWEDSQYGQWTVQGDVYKGFVKDTLRSPFSTTWLPDGYNQQHGFNLLGRWKLHFPADEFVIQTYYDLNHREESFHKEFRGTYDLDFQHRHLFGPQQEVIWGLGYRYTHDITDGSPVSVYIPDRRQNELLSAFVQSEFKMPLSALLTTQFVEGEVDDLQLNLGVKFEHNQFTGLEIQPSMRLLRHLGPETSIWTAISRSVRIPSRIDRDILAVGDRSNLQVIVEGNPDFKSEILQSYELGYRWQPSHQLLWDMSLFYNQYYQLRTLELLALEPLKIRSQFANQMTGEVYGLEMTYRRQLTPNWQFALGYGYTDTQLHIGPTSSDETGENMEGNDPRHQLNLQGVWKLSPDLKATGGVYYVDNLPNQGVPSYWRVDGQLSWRPNPHLELSLGGRNLTEAYHPEFSREVGLEQPLGEVPRTFYLQFRYQSE